MYLKNMRWAQLNYTIADSSREEIVFPNIGSQTAGNMQATPKENKRKRKAESSVRPPRRAEESPHPMDPASTPSAVPSIVVNRAQSSNEFGRTGPENSDTAASSQGSAGSTRSLPSTQESLESDCPAPALDSQSFIIPSNLECTLDVAFVTFEGSRTPAAGKNLVLSVHDPENYDRIQTEAHLYVSKNFAEYLEFREVSFRYGNCKIIGDKGYLSRLPLTSRQDWKEIYRTIISYRTEHSDENLRLAIWREYHGCQNCKTDEATLTAAKSLEIHELMRRSSDKSLERFTYISHTDLDNVVPRHLVPDIINEDPCMGMDPKQKDAFIHTVQSKARILLAMCLYVEMPMHCLKKLLDGKIADSTLPITRDEPCHKRHPCVRRYESLIEKQGRFLAARFDKPGEHQDLDHGVVVPVRFCLRDTAEADPTSEEGKKSRYKVKRTADLGASAKEGALCGSGAFSRVYRVKLDPSHHSLSKDKDAYFALKEFRHRPEKVTLDFQKELKILNVLRKYRHDHIVTHLVTWTHDEMYCMLFPFAQSNLREYMGQRQFNAHSKADLMWLLEQFNGLASALKQIHDLSDEAAVSNPTLYPPSPILPGEYRSGWHHDLKPENSLFFWATDPPRGTFRISDWGSGKVNTYRSGSINTPNPHGTPTYEPPEIIYEGRTSRPYDVWSLGCVFLELLVWASRDFNAVKMFGGNRLDRRDLTLASILQDNAFWQKNIAGKFVLRKAVCDQIRDLDEVTMRRKLSAFKPALNLVKEMLNLERDKRIRALDVDDTLRRICQQTKIDFENIDSSAAEKDDPSLPRLSVKAPERRPSDPSVFANSPTARHTGPAYTDLLYASPIDTNMRRSHSRNSSASELGLSSVPHRSRTISNASSKSGLSIKSTPEAVEEDK